MTITLQCTHCNQPMQIAPRKPGSRVTCPVCGQAVTVPAAEPAGRAAPSGQAAVAAAIAAAAPARAAAATGQTAAPAIPSARRRPASEAATVRAAHPESLAATELNVPLIEPPADGVTLPLSVLILSLVFALAALGLAFFAGFLLGKSG
jgi:ribosomal protein S27E